MFRFFYQWRYRREQRAGAFKIPDSTDERSRDHANFSSYLSQSSVRGRQVARFDLPRRGSQGLKIIFRLGLLALLIWLIYESAVALALFKN